MPSPGDILAVIEAARRVLEADHTSGNFVVGWTSNAQDGSSPGVFGQRYGQIVPVELMGFAVE